MKNRFQVILSLSVFIILLIGFFTYSLWVEQIVFNNLKKQALADNLTIGESVLNMLDKSGVSPDNKADFIRIVQETTDVLKMPNKGFICMADSMGTLLAAPGLKPDNNVSINSGIFLNIEREKSQKYSDFFSTNPFIGYFEKPNDKYSDVIVGLNHPYTGFKILVHQDAITIKEHAKAKSLPLLWAGFIFAIAIAIISYIIISRQIKTYQNKIEDQQLKLKASNEEIREQNKELEKQNILLKELAEEKDILLGIMAHDLRNPLGGIESVVNLIDKIGDLSEDQKTYFSLLKPQVESAQLLISDVLEMNNLENEKKNLDKIEIDLNQFISNKINEFTPLANEKGIQLSLKEECSNLTFHSSINELNRITDNLLSNAIKYTPIGKSVWVDIQKDKERVKIKFIDEGAGIPEEERVLLFKKFSKLSTRPTNEESSTGLGLYIVKLLSERIEGELNVESQIGKGSIFTISIRAN